LPLDSCPRPEQSWPQRVPLKVLGRLGELRPDRVSGLILAQLGPQDEGDCTPQANLNGAFVSYTFWVTLPDPEAEIRLRESLTKLPGYVLQL
jgi:hypothetical protein